AQRDRGGRRVIGDAAVGGVARLLAARGGAGAQEQRDIVLDDQHVVGAVGGHRGVVEIHVEVVQVGQGRLFDVRQDVGRPGVLQLAADVGGRVVHAAGGKALVGTLEVVQGQADLLEVVLALHAGGGLA